MHATCLVMKYWKCCIQGARVGGGKVDGPKNSGSRTICLVVDKTVIVGLDHSTSQGGC